MLLRRLGLVLLLWLCGLSAALADKRVALLIAAEDYDYIRPLENPGNDARALEQVLENLDFEVFLETNRDLNAPAARWRTSGRTPRVPTWRCCSSPATASRWTG